MAVSEIERACLGIDFGTTYSEITLFPKGSQSPMVLKDTNEDTYIPSVVYYKNEKKVKIGSAAKNGKAESTIYENKRFLGSNYSRVKEMIGKYPFKIVQGFNDRIEYVLGPDDNTFIKTPMDVAVEQMKHFKKTIETRCESYKIDMICITVPIRFTSQQRAATALAGMFYLVWNIYTILY